MKLFRRTPVEDPRDTRIRELEEFNEELVKSIRTMRGFQKRDYERQQKRIDALVDEKHRLRIQADAYQRALRVKQGELERALAEVKRLDAELVKVAT